MRLWPRSTSEEIRAAFAFLVEEHGYRLVADSGDGMGGAVTYRSDDLWVAVEWDRSKPWLEFAPTHSSVGRFDWELVGHLLRGAEHWERGMNDPARTATPEELAGWLRERLAEIEARFRLPERDATNARLECLAAERRSLREQWWAQWKHRTAD
jgi:hypothetical protein